MENYHLPQINHIGRKHVEQWLAENGYFDVSKEQVQSNDFGFIAKGKVENIMVQVRTFMHPQRPFKLSSFETDALIAKAGRLGLVAYAAYVVINENDELAHEITWERLGRIQ